MSYVSPPISRNLLKDTDKEDLIDHLMKLYKIRKRSNVYAIKSIPHHPKFQEYALHDNYLTKKLHQYFLSHHNYPIWLKLSRLHFQQWQNGFQGVEVDVQAVNQRIQKMNQLRDQILSKLPNNTTPKSKASNKGWSSPRLISSYLTTHFPIKDLGEPLESGIYPFENKTNRLKLLQKYPNNPIIKLVNDLKKKDSIIEDLITIREKSS